MPEVEETGIDDFLVVPVHNLSTSDRIYGIDDYSDLDSVIQELEIRLAQISRDTGQARRPEHVWPGQWH